jgi:hypothetical protein
MTVNSFKVSLARVFSHLFRAAITAVPIAASPVGASLVGDKSQRLPLIWPPVGSLMVYAVPLASLIVGLVGWTLPKLLKKRASARFSVLSLGLAFVSLFLYFYLVSRYVKEVETPHNGTQYRTIGSVRTVDAQKMFSKMSDQDLLKTGGLEDGDIETMWTPFSVLRVRLELLITYVLCLSFVNFVMGNFGRL